MHAIRLPTTGKARPMGSRPQMQRQLHTAFTNNEDDELRDSRTQAQKGDEVEVIRVKECIGFGLRVNIILCNSPHTHI